MTQQYSLRWNNHQPNFISMFTTLLNTQTLVDVTLAAEGKHLQAHKVVLSACSTYFQALFMDNPSRHPIVILKDVTFADLRTMVDFMYYGEVNVTEEQLPQVLDTAKTLKIKGLTEMPDSTSLTRSQGTSADFPSGDQQDGQRHLVSPVHSPRRRKRRRSSTGSLQMSAGDEGRVDEDGGGGEAGSRAHGTADLLRGDAITLSSVPQRRRDYEPRPHQDTHPHQASEAHNMNVDQLGIETNSAGMPQDSSCGGSASGSQVQAVKLRRSKYFKRQNRVPEDTTLRKQSSEPLRAPHASVPPLQKHESYPQYSHKSRLRVRTQEQAVGSLLIRAVTVIDRQPALSVSGPSASTSTATAREKCVDSEPEPACTRASHTPAVRSGPPLSCNFCWNTVDECGRILRRKTQYHCPECRTNLCIVPCFHEYHDGHEPDQPPPAPPAPASAR